MRDLEAEMAKALEGQFFWEHTSGDEPATSGDTYKIRVAQREFIDRKTKEEIAAEKKEDRLKRLRETIEREKERQISVCSVNHYLKSDIKQFIDRLAEVIAEVHNVPLDIMLSKSRVAYVIPAKHHHAWAFRRYFPGINDSDAARFLGKDRTSIYNSEERFERMASEYADKINAVDIIMGYVPG